MRAATAVSGLWISCVCWCAGPGSEQSKHKLEKFDNVIWGKVGPLMFYLVRHSPCLPPAALRSISNVFRPNTILCTSARNLYTRKNEMQLRPFSANDMTGCRFPGLNTVTVAHNSNNFGVMIKIWISGWNFQFVQRLWALQHFNFDAKN